MDDVMLGGLLLLRDGDDDDESVASVVVLVSANTADVTTAMKAAKWVLVRRWNTSAHHPTLVSTLSMACITSLFDCVVLFLFCVVVLCVLFVFRLF